MTAYYEDRDEQGVWDRCGLDPVDVTFLKSTIDRAVAAARNNPLFGQSSSCKRES